MTLALTDVERLFRQAFPNALLRIPRRGPLPHRADPAIVEGRLCMYTVVGVPVDGGYVRLQWNIPAFPDKSGKQVPLPAEEFHKRTSYVARSLPDAMAWVSKAKTEMVAAAVSQMADALNPHESYLVDPHGSFASKIAGVFWCLGMDHVQAANTITPDLVPRCSWERGKSEGRFLITIKARDRMRPWGHLAYRLLGGQWPDVPPEQAEALVSTVFPLLEVQNRYTIPILPGADPAAVGLQVIEFYATDMMAGLYNLAQSQQTAWAARENDAPVDVSWLTVK